MTGGGAWRAGERLSPEGHEGPAIPDASRLAAMEWQVTLWSGEVTAEEEAEFARWLRADPAHQQAWEQVQRLGRELHAVPAPAAVSSRVLRASGSPLTRRNLLRGLGLLAGGGAAFHVARATPQWRVMAADQRTATGERRDVILPDGTRVMLNTASAIDLRYTATERRVVLRAGEILIATAADNAPSHRPFMVETRAGQLRALGTRFTVRDPGADAGEVRVQVFEGAVEVSPRHGARLRLDAGGQASFSSHAITGAGPADAMAPAWSRGLLVAERMRLADFLAELGRYRPGILRCDPEVVGLIVSGVYRLDDTDAVLLSLSRALPVRVRGLTRYWVTVSAA